MWEPQGNLRLLLFFANFAAKNIMPKFSEMGRTFPEYRKYEVEKFHIESAEKGLRFQRWTLIISIIALVVSIVALLK